MVRQSAVGRFDSGGPDVRSFGRPDTYASSQLQGESVESPDLFTPRLGLIDQIVEAVAYRNGFKNDVAEDFHSVVCERLLENDQDRLRKFAGRASWKTYLTTVIANLARDYRNHLWGKWRPSAAAQDLGPDAVRLEKLLYRDRRPLSEAAEIVVRESDQGLTSSDVHWMYGRLPVRYRRELVGLDAVGDLPGDESADALLWSNEEHEELRRVGEALEDALDELAPEERVMVKMRYVDGFTLARIGEVFGLTPQSTDRRIRKAVRALRRHFE